MTPFMATLSRGQIKIEELNKPEYFFVRYGLNWFQHYLDEGEEGNEAFFGAVWRHNVKLANFIFLNWLEVMHDDPPQEFDEDRFFMGDHKAAQAYCHAACS